MGFPFYKGQPDPHSDIVRKYCEAMERSRVARLEEQGRIFLKMGFREEELCIIKENGRPDMVELKIAFGIED